MQPRIRLGRRWCVGRDREGAGRRRRHGDVDVLGGHLEPAATGEHLVIDLRRGPFKRHGPRDGRQRPDTVSPPALAITYAWSGVRCDEGGATDQCTFAPEDEGVTTVLLTATDDDGATTNVSVDVLATNLAPSLDPVRFIMNGTEVPPEDGWVLNEDQAVNLMVAVDDTR